MKTKCPAILGTVLVLAGFSPAGARQSAPAPAPQPFVAWVYQPTPWVLDVPEPGVAPAAAARPPSRFRLAGSAVVEVWGDANWELTERLRLFKVNLAPGLDRAYKVGTASSITAQALSDFMASATDLSHLPAVPDVYFNALRQVQDPDLARQGIHVDSRTSKVTWTAGPR